MAMFLVHPSTQGNSANDHSFDNADPKLSHGLQVGRKHTNARTDWASWESLRSALSGQDVTQVLRRWQSELNRSAADEIAPMVNELQSAIQEGISSLKLTARADSILDKHQSDVLLSICLIETLQEVATSFCSTYGIVSTYVFSGWHSIELESLETQMIASGWCPNHVHMCRKVFGLATLIFSSTISRPFQRTHPNC
jgi:hypothetical protein